MNWHQFRLFLLEQLDSLRIESSIGIQSDPSEEIQNYELMSRSPHISTSNIEFDMGPQRDFNWHGIPAMYSNFLIRELADTPGKLGLVGYGAGVSKFTPRTFFQSVRSIPAAIAIGQAPRNFTLFTMYVNDVRQGRFPGTEISFFS